MSLNGISFDISDDSQFKTFVVQKLTQLDERTKPLEEMRVKLEKVPLLELEVNDLREEMKSTKKWGRIHSAIGPTMVIVQGTLHKLGIF